MMPGAMLRRVRDFLLDLLFIGKELNIVDQQYI